MPAYSDPKYWEERYQQQPVAFDWYQGYAGLRQVITEHLPPNKMEKLLHIGVGTSVIQENMVREDGYKSIVNVDISNCVIQHMAELHQNIPQLSYRVADCRDMEDFKNESFDGVLDKGTLDALMCGEGCSPEIYKVLRECYRVLKPAGSMVIVTYGDPSTRLHYFDGDPQCLWDIEVYVITKITEGTYSVTDSAGPTIIKGPYKTDNLDAMDALSTLDNVHFAYCIKKLLS